MSPPVEPPTKRYRLGIAIATLVGAAWRLVMLVSKWNVPLAYSDAWYYSLQAINNAHGHWFKEASGPLAGWGVLPGAEHPPLTSLIVTPAGLLSNPIFWQRATITVLGIALVPLVGLLARRIGGPLVGVIAASIAAVYPNMWMSDAVVMSETITKVAVVLVLLAALRHVERFDLRSAALLGAAVGLAGYARSELIFYAPLLALVGARSYPWREWSRRAAPP
jgi:4-amino-4-deoxy-L-arabinose transferase-like glycosyltransferase